MRQNKNYIFAALAALSLILYVLLGYYSKRADHFTLAGIYIILFACYGWFLKYYEREDLTKFLVISGLFRLVFLFSFPVLSDDIHRFIWDGKLILQGTNPYLYLPSSIALDNEMMQGLYESMNSKNYYSVYPPVSQWIFTFAAAVSPHSILGATIAIRVLIFAAEAGSLYLLYKLLINKHEHRQTLFFYALNPLVILELSGNLHFEAFLIFFTLLAYTLLKYGKTILPGIMMGLAVGVKLLPLIFLPFFIRRLGKRGLVKFFTALGISLILIFVPFFYTGGVEGILQSVLLYFKKFEFNASIYYLVREWGFYDKGYNIISSAGPKLALATFILIMGLAILDKFKKMKLMDLMIFAGLIYFMFATTVHPWYIVPLVAFSVLTHFRWPVVWSFFIFFTYMGYSATGYSEIYIILIFEYVLLSLYLVYELWNNLEDKSVIDK